MLLTCFYSQGAEEGQVLLALVLLSQAPLEGAGSLDSLWPLPLLGASPGPGLCGTLPRCLNYVLEELKHNAKAEVMVASHNEDTVQFALRR